MASHYDFESVTTTRSSFKRYLCGVFVFIRLFAMWTTLMSKETKRSSWLITRRWNIRRFYKEWVVTISKWQIQINSWELSFWKMKRQLHTNKCNESYFPDTYNGLHSWSAACRQIMRRRAVYMCYRVYPLLNNRSIITTFAVLALTVFFRRLGMNSCWKRLCSNKLGLQS